jgi:hypothetical protein
MYFFSAAILLFHTVQISIILHDFISLVLVPIVVCHSHLRNSCIHNAVIADREKFKMQDVWVASNGMTCSFSEKRPTGSKDEMEYTPRHKRCVSMS